MPTSGGYYYGVGTSDPRRWERCLRETAVQMIAQGWQPKAGKFRAVQQRRARRMFAPPA